MPGGIHLLISSTKASTVLYVHNKHGCLNWRPPFVIMLYLASLSNQNLPFHRFHLHNQWTRIACSFESFNFERIKVEICLLALSLLLLLPGFACTVCHVHILWQSQSLQLSSAMESFQNMMQDTNNSQNIYQSLVSAVKFTSKVKLISYLDSSTSSHPHYWSAAKDNMIYGIVEVGVLSHNNLERSIPQQNGPINCWLTTALSNILRIVWTERKTSQDNGN